MNYLFSPKPISCASIIGSDSLFPINRIFCVGRNYHAHAKEMGVTIDKTNSEPFYFLKDASSVINSKSHIDYPSMTSNYQHEIELAIAINKDGHLISKDNAFTHIFGFAVALDMTRRDLQFKAKGKGLPWDLGKNFEKATVLSPILPKSNFIGNIEDCTIELKVNGELRQSDKISSLIWNIPELLEDLSKYYHLQAGDLILTGTPEGVSPIEKGDSLYGKIENVGELELHINP